MNAFIARIRPILTGLRFLVLAIAILKASRTSQAAIVYKFSGQIPSNINPSADTHPLIAPGETWVATFLIDETTTGSVFYYGAVISGDLRFSGGFVSPVDFSGLDVVVIDGINDDAIAVLGDTWGGPYSFTAVSNQNPLSSGGLPLPGTNFLPSPSVTNDPYLQLRYWDINGSISYAANLSNNISFAASLPEPASLILASLLGGSLVLARRRR